MKFFGTSRSIRSYSIPGTRSKIGQLRGEVGLESGFCYDFTLVSKSLMGQDIRGSRKHGLKALQGGIGNMEVV